MDILLYKRIKKSHNLIKTIFNITKKNIITISDFLIHKKLIF